MTALFSQGYALLVGVGRTAYARWSLPVTVQDVQTLRSVLVNTDLCGYPDDESHVCVLVNESSTRQNILDRLKWLENQTSLSAGSTAIIFYSGHGWKDQGTGKYYLIPHDADPLDLPSTALSGDDFSTALRKIHSARLLVFIDSCHAAGVATSKGLPSLQLPSGYSPIALPKSISQDIRQGQGRAVFSSSTGAQKSWIRPDGKLSLYTYHLVEALHGAGSRVGETFVRLSDLMYYLNKAVPESSRVLGSEQTPFADLAAEDFEVALLRGGKGMPGNPLATIKEESNKLTNNLFQVYGDRTVVINGNAQGNTIITGDRNTIVEKAE